MNRIRDLARRSVLFRVALGALLLILACLCVLVCDAIDKTRRDHYFASVLGLPHSWTEWSPDYTEAYLENLFAVGQDRSTIVETLSTALRDKEWTLTCSEGAMYEGQEYCQISFEPLLRSRFFDRSLRFDREGKVVWSARTIAME